MSVEYYPVYTCHNMCISSSSIRSIDPPAQLPKQSSPLPLWLSIVLDASDRSSALKSPCTGFCDVLSVSLLTDQSLFCLLWLVFLRFFPKILSRTPWALSPLLFPLFPWFSSLSPGFTLKDSQIHTLSSNLTRPASPPPVTCNHQNIVHCSSTNAIDHAKGAILNQLCLPPGTRPCCCHFLGAQLDALESLSTPSFTLHFTRSPSPAESTSKMSPQQLLIFHSNCSVQYLSFHPPLAFTSSLFFPSLFVPSNPSYLQPPY